VILPGWTREGDLFPSAVLLLVRLGHHAEHVRDLGMHAALDAQIATYARQSRAIMGITVNRYRAYWCRRLV
jgi:predicted nuclease of predicted toxin-antitoxin system